MLARIVLICAVIASVASAQRGGGGRGGGMGMGGGEFGMPSSRSRLDIYSDMLKLSKEQKKDFKSSMDEAQKEATPVHQEILKSRGAIAEAVRAGKSQDELNPLINAEAAMETQMVNIELKAFLRLFKSLDAEQQQRVNPILFMMKGVFSGKNWNSTE